MNFDVVSYRKNKTVKLSDAFLVHILDKTPSGKDIADFKVNGVKCGKDVLGSEKVNSVLDTVVSAKIPNLRTTQDVLKYSTFSHRFDRLDLDSAPEPLEITAYETSDNKVSKVVNYMLEKCGYNEALYSDYEPYRFVDQIDISILSNDLTRTVLKYTFKRVKLIGYNYSYSYDYKDSSLPLVTMSFSYEEFCIEDEIGN